MADVTLEVLAAQMERLLGELAEMRGEMAVAAMRAAMLHIKNQIKDMLGRIDGQVRKLEEEKERAAER